MRLIFAIFLCVLSFSCHCLVPASECSSVLHTDPVFKHIRHEYLNRTDIQQMLLAQTASLTKPVLLVGEFESGKTVLTQAIASKLRFDQRPYAFIRERPIYNVSTIPLVEKYFKSHRDMKNNRDLIMFANFSDTLAVRLPAETVLLFDLNARDFGANDHFQDPNDVKFDFHLMYAVLNLSRQAALGVVTMSRFLFDHLKLTPEGRSILEQMSVIHL